MSTLPTTLAGTQLKISVHDIQRAHAKLSASGAHKWLNCTASAWAESGFPDESTDYADEGTRAHDMGKDCLHLGIDVSDWCMQKFGREPEDLAEHDPDIADLYPLDMFECIQGYIEYVRDEIEQAKLRNPDAIVYIEERVDFSVWVPEGFGTADCVIISDGVIRVIDYKHGKGVFVEVEGNEQLMLYGGGAHNMFRHLFSYTEMQLTIYQPRVSNIRTYSTSAAQLENWLEAYVKPTAAKVWYALETGDLTGVEFNPMDEDTCRFCKAKVHCRARAQRMLDMAQFEKDTALMSDAEVLKVLPEASHLSKWAADLEKWARGQVEKGKKLPGFKLVEGRSTRKYSNEGAVKSVLIMEGYEEKQFTKTKLLGLTDMTKLLKGAKKLDTLLGSFIVKPKGKPVLVPASDPRPELNNAESTAAEFEAAESE